MLTNVGRRHRHNTLPFVHGEEAEGVSTQVATSRIPDPRFNSTFKLEHFQNLWMVRFMEPPDVEFRLLYSCGGA